MTDLHRLRGNVRTYLYRERKVFNDSARHLQMIYENVVKL